MKAFRTQPASVLHTPYIVMRKFNIISYLYQLIIAFYWVTGFSLVSEKEKSSQEPAWYCKISLSVARSCPGTQVGYGRFSCWTWNNFKHQQSEQVTLLLWSRQKQSHSIIMWELRQKQEHWTTTKMTNHPWLISVTDTILTIEL